MKYQLHDQIRFTQGNFQGIKGVIIDIIDNEYSIIVEQEPEFKLAILKEEDLNVIELLTIEEQTHYQMEDIQPDLENIFASYTEIN